MLDDEMHTDLQGENKQLVNMNQVLMLQNYPLKKCPLTRAVSKLVSCTVTIMANTFSVISRYSSFIDLVTITSYKPNDCLYSSGGT